MAEKETHYGDEDPEGLDDPETEEELFETSKFLGWKPEDMLDKEFAARYKAWLARQAD